MRPARRLIVAVLALVLLDQCVPAVLQRAERHRYEETQAFRFQPSDLFGLGPLVSYLREHPRGERPRTMFLGNSILFGLDLSAEEAVPGQFQRLHPETQVFNAAINGFELGSNALVAAAMVDSVDRFYVMRGPAAKNPLLASLIPVGEYEDLPRPNLLESRLQRAASVWRLYALSYRLQAALFGTSTRQFLHRYVSLARATAHPSQDGAITVTRSRSPSPPTAARRAELLEQDPALSRVAALMVSRLKRAVVLQIGEPTPGALGAAEIAEFNAAFAPYVEIVTLTIPPALTFDGHHLTALGARRLAEALP